jgi:putative PEP-CTERM system TPR-repeat lipoprotein
MKMLRLAVTPPRSYTASNFRKHQPMNRQYRTNARRVVGVLLALTLAALVGCGDSLTDADHVDRAKAAYAGQNLRTAEIELKNALRKNPTNSEARWLLGNLYLENGLGGAAEKELRKAQQLGTSPTSVIPMLAMALLMQGEADKLLAETAELNGLPPSDMARVLAYRGEAYLALDKQAEAEVEFEKALAAMPDSPWAKLGMARLFIARGDLKEASTWIEKATQSQPELGRVWSVAAWIAELSGDLAAAEEHYTKAIDLRPNNHIRELIRRALVRISLERDKDAWADIALLKIQAGDHYMTTYVEGVLQFKSRQYAEAQTSLEKVLNQKPDFAEAQYYLAASHLALNQLEQARSLANKVFYLNQNSIGASRLMALVTYQAGNFKDALKFIAPVVWQQPDDISALALRADAALRLGHNEIAIEDLERLVKLDPKSARAQTQLGAALLRQGDRSRGLAMLDAAVALEPDLVEGRVRTILDHVQHGEQERAEALIAKLKTDFPDDTLPLKLSGVSAMAGKQLEKARSQFEQVIRADPYDVAANVSLGALELAEQQHEEARTYFEAALQRDPDNVRALLGLAAVDGQSRNFKGMESHLNKAIKAAPEAVEPRVELAELYNELGRAADSVALLSPVEDSGKTSSAFLFAYVEALMAAGDAAKGLEVASALSTQAPDSARAFHILSRAFAASGRWIEMRAALDKSLSLDPEYVPAQISMIRFLGIQGDVSEASRRMDTLSQQAPADPEVWATATWLAMQFSDSAREEQLEIALQRSPSERFAIELAKLQWDAGRQEDALQSLQEWSAAHPESRLSRFLSATFLAALGRHDEEIAQLEQVLQLSPQDPVVLNNLAWALRGQDPERALIYAERAVELDRSSASATDTLAQILLQVGQTTRGLELARYASSLAPNDMTIRYHLALATIANGNAAEGREILARLLGSDASFREREEAQRTLQSIR